MDRVEIAVNYFNQEKFDDAEKIALEIFAQNPSSEDALDILSAIYLKTNNLNFLKDNFKQKLSLLRQIAIFIEKLQMYEQAVFFYNKALEIEPDDYVAYNNLGLIYEKLEDIDNAQSAYEKSLKIKENYPATYNLGVLYRKKCELDKSEMYLKKATVLNPTNQYASYSLGMTYLMQKKFNVGYKYFLKRPIKGVEFSKNNFWNGEIHKDKTILVYSEYGLGDAIMFSRYLPFLKNYFENVVVCVKKSLINLMEKSFEDITFICDVYDVDYDFVVFMMDLPYYLKMDFKSIPVPDGYLKADDSKVQDYKNNYFNNDLLKIGLFYIGGELEKRNAKYRAIELFRLQKLLTLNNCKFYSFQKDDLFDELNDFPSIVDLGKTFNDFSDTAAAMKNLDLLITIDSSPVHLAGALGVKSYLMLPYYSEWRWFTDDKTTAWYDSVEIIKQTTPCDWQSVVDKIYNKLKK